MIRFFLLLACWLSCIFCSALGFPAPKPKDPPTNAELIVGIWEVVIMDGKAPPRAWFIEFSREGSFHGFSRPGCNNCSDGQYEIDEAKLVVKPDKGSQVFHIKSITAKKLTLQDAKNVAEIAELRKK
jgi:hypothetical protein